jgi:hypothetical protein
MDRGRVGAPEGVLCRSSLAVEKKKEINKGHRSRAAKIQEFKYI